MAVSAPVAYENQLTVETEEVDGSPIINTIDPYRGVFDATRILKCAWADVPQLTKELLGYWEIAGAGLIYHYPHPFPNYDGLEYIQARKIQQVMGFGMIEAAAGTTRVSKYEFALVHVQYCTPEISSGSGWCRLPDNTGNWRREACRSSVTMAKIDRINLAWESDSIKTTEDQIPSYPIRQPEWHYSVKTNYNYLSDLIDYVGYCNSYPIYSPTFGGTFAAGTLLFLDIMQESCYTCTGLPLLDVTLKFQFLKTGFNWFPRSDKIYNGGLYYDRILCSGSLVTFFPAFNFTPYIV